MFKMKVHSGAFVETMRKVSIGIPVSGQKGESDGVKIVFYKSIKGMPDMSKGIFLAFDGKVQAVSSMDISNVTADVEEAEVHISGKKALAAANAYAALDMALEIEIDKDVKISAAGNKVTLPLGQKIVALKPDGRLLQEIEMHTEDFINFVNFASSCYGEEKGSRGLHCVGIRIDPEKKVMIGASSNGTRCAYAESQNVTFRPVKNREEGAADNKVITVVIEGKTLRNAVKNLEKKKVTIGIDAKMLRIKCGSDVVMIMTQEIPFPMDAILQVMDRTKRVGAWKARLTNVLQALAIYEITMETPWLEIKKQGETQVILQGKDEQSNAAVICAQDGDIQTVAVNEKEFKNSLSVFSKEKDIIIETMSDKMPIVMRQHEDDKNKIFLMPVSE